MPSYRIRIKPNIHHGHDNRHQPGDEIIVTAEEFHAFRDKFIELERIEDTAVEQSPTEAPAPFVLTDKTPMDDIMSAFNAGHITAEEILEFENGRAKPRKTLLAQVEAAMSKAVEA